MLQIRPLNKSHFIVQWQLPSKILKSYLFSFDMKINVTRFVVTQLKMINFVSLIIDVKYEKHT